MPRYYRKIIRITAEDSPNVRRAVLLKERYPDLPYDELCRASRVLPGVLSWDEYQKRLQTWDKVMQCIGLRGEFWHGAEVLLFPPDWLNHANDLARLLRTKRPGTAMGCDPAEGGDKSCWSVIDERGLVHLESIPTPNTSVIPRRTIALMREYGVPADRVCFDRGGGGQQHADTLRDMGYPVRTVSFGRIGAPEPKRRTVTFFSERVEQHETKGEWASRAAQMYGELSERLDPAGQYGGFGIPREYAELRRQLALLPKLYDRDGRLRMLPKHDPKDAELAAFGDAASARKRGTLVGLIGHSPDEADSLVLALHALLHKRQASAAGFVGAV